MQVRCPHCRNPIELIDDGALDEVNCPSCGSNFSLIGGENDQTFRPDTIESIDHFELLEKLGVGAFGTVWKAHDTDLDRTVAVKIPRRGQLGPEDAEKFLREARAVAQLRHPGIVSVYEVGRQDDTIYIVSDCIDGLALTDWLTGQRPTPREAAELCVKIAEALHHAHEHGVIHRDLKPSNIMLDREGEPHIMDFGLAKREAGEITMTMDGQVLGTPAYMSPEQAAGEGHHVDRTADLYSLGVILFELLTGERPFRGNARMLIHQVLTEDAPSPRVLNSAIPRDLETVCLKCLEKEPRRRYQTADEVAKDLNRYLELKPILARPISRVARGVRWFRRNPLIGSLSILILVMLFLTTTLWIKASSANRRASEAGALELSSYDRLHARLSPSSKLGGVVGGLQSGVWRVFVPAQEKYQLKVAVDFMNHVEPYTKDVPDDAGIMISRAFSSDQSGKEIELHIILAKHDGNWMLRMAGVGHGTEQLGIAPFHARGMERGETPTIDSFHSGGRRETVTAGEDGKLLLFKWTSQEFRDGKRVPGSERGIVCIWIEPMD